MVKLRALAFVFSSLREKWFLESLFLWYYFCVKFHTLLIARFSLFPDRLHISFFKESSDNHEKTGIPLVDFYGIESGFPLEKESHVLAILCEKNVVILSFNGRETLIEWEIRIRNHLGEGKFYRFHGQSSQVFSCFCHFYSAKFLPFFCRLLIFNLLSIYFQIQHQSNLTTEENIG